MNARTRHVLPAGELHTTWDGALPPALEIADGDVVEIATKAATGDQLLPGDGDDALARIDWGQVHPLSGPIAVRGAEPGCTLEIEVLRCVPGDWGYACIDPTFGLLKERFRDPRLRFFELDREAGSVEFAPGVDLRLAPFLGVMGVAPTGPPRTTFAPGDHGGNIDCKELVAGSRLFLPVLVPGARFSCGDGHALQGDGEICSAIECEMDVALAFRVHERRISPRPVVVAGGELLTIGSGASLLAALQEAAADMVDLLGRWFGIGAEDAYMLLSLAGDARIDELVNSSPVVYGAKLVMPLAALAQLDRPTWMGGEASDGD